MIDDIHPSKHNWGYNTYVNITASLYGIGKVSTYLILLLRIRTLLQSSIFDFRRGTYYRIFAMLSLNFFCSVAAGVLSNTIGPSQLLDVVALSWMFSDIVICTLLTKLFLSKLFQIYKTMEKAQIAKNVRMHNNDSGIRSTSPTSSSFDIHATNNSTNKVPSMSNTSTNRSDEQSIAIDCNDNININNNNNVNGRMDNHTNGLFEMVIRFGVLELVIIISSVMVFLSMVFTGAGKDAEQISHNMYYGLHLDSTVNIVCILCMFNFSTSFYQYFCKICHWSVRQCVFRLRCNNNCCVK